MTERSTYFGVLHAKNAFEYVKGTITEIYFFISKKTIINFLSYQKVFESIAIKLYFVAVAVTVRSKRHLK